MSSPAPFDVLASTAHELSRLLREDKLTSVQIVSTYLSQIEAHNHAGADLKAIISTPPRNNVLLKARILDQERQAGRLRGPFHGLPIIVKDTFVFEPDMEMKTTVGSFVFAEEEGKKNAGVVQQLVDQGMIILGTANLTEFCGHKAGNLETGPMTPGWSAYGGQTRSAYDPNPIPLNRSVAYKDGHAGGSSAGSAVGVSAGFSPFSLGTETGGSLVYPASKSGLYALRPTLGSVNADGVFRISRSFDGIGGMAKTPEDLAILIESILTPEARTRILGGLPGNHFSGAMNGSWAAVKVGIVASTWAGADEKKWGREPVKSKYESVVSVIRENGGRVVFPAVPPTPDTLKHDGLTMKDIAYHEFNTVIKEFCAAFASPKVLNLTEIIEWNAKHADIALPQPHPDQKAIEESLASILTDEKCAEAYQTIRQLAGKDGMARYMKEQDLDLIVSCSDCSLISFTACAGYPSATVPLGQLENGLPYGMFILARAHEEYKIFQFMSAFEKSMAKVECPNMKGISS